MMLFGSILFALGAIIWFAGEIKLLVLAYRQSLWWFFGCLFIPLVFWVFFALNLKQAWKPAVIATIGFIITAIGYNIGGLG
jgi:hypothetical protein